MAKQERPRQLSPINIDQVVFGIRYQPQWKIRDRLGKIIDDVLDGEPFNPDVFPNSRYADTSHALFNPATGTALRSASEIASWL